jgi:hypothetical protein
VFAEASAISFEEGRAMPRLFDAHVIEELGGSGISLAQAVGEIRVDAPIFFFEGDSERQNFALGQIFEVSCHATSLLFLALVSTTGNNTVLTVSIPSKYPQRTAAFASAGPA